MKQKDILLIVVIAIVAGVISIVAANLLFGGENKYDQKAPEVNEISSEFKQPNEKYYNDKSLNPTKDIKIGDDTNDKPFEDGE
jgi:flagellar basal body-associated protein FliL